MKSLHFGKKDVNEVRNRRRPAGTLFPARGCRGSLPRPPDPTSRNRERRKHVRHAKRGRRRSDIPFSASSRPKTPVFPNFPLKRNDFRRCRFFRHEFHSEYGLRDILQPEAGNRFPKRNDFRRCRFFRHEFHSEYEFRDGSPEWKAWSAIRRIPRPWTAMAFISANRFEAGRRGSLSVRLASNGFRGYDRERARNDNGPFRNSRGRESPGNDPPKRSRNPDSTLQAGKKP